MIVKAKVAVPILAAMVLIPVACGAASQFRLSIYDPSHKATTRLTLADVVRSSAEATRDAGGFPILSFRLTDTGAIKFHKLTRDLARRGAQLQQRQYFAFEIDGHVYARPFVDYRAYANGFYGKGIQIGGLKLTAARRLASEIRTG